MVMCFRCDKDTQTMLSNMTFEELITSQNGLHVSRTLVNVIINRQIGQQISVRFYPAFKDSFFLIIEAQIDTVSEILQQRCGSFCSADDVMLYKVHSVRIKRNATLTLFLLGAGKRSQSIGPARSQ